MRIGASNQRDAILLRELQEMPVIGNLLFTVDVRLDLQIVIGLHQLFVQRVCYRQAVKRRSEASTDLDDIRRDAEKLVKRDTGFVIEVIGGVNRFYVLACIVRLADKRIDFLDAIFILRNQNRVVVVALSVHVAFCEVYLNTMQIL